MRFLHQKPGRLQEISVRSLRLALPISDPGLAELFMSEPNPGLSNSRPGLIVTGATLGGTSAIGGAVLSVPNPKVRHHTQKLCPNNLEYL